MDLKIASAIVERQMFPKHTNSTETGSGVEAIVVVVSHLLGGLGGGFERFDSQSTGVPWTRPLVSFHSFFSSLTSFGYLCHHKHEHSDKSPRFQTPSSFLFTIRYCTKHSVSSYLGHLSK
jgi:hypothetical protein